MASQAPQQAPRRQSSRQEAPASQMSNEPSGQEAGVPILIQYTQAGNDETSGSRDVPNPQGKEPRTCWVCQMDDTDDTAENSEWRTPCPCSLTAHDSCLQEWISNEEAPKPGEIAHNHRIKCPQCQAEIRIDRPYDFLVAIAEVFQKATKKMIVPTALSAVAGCTYSGLLVYGLNTMTMVFGVDDALRILKPPTTARGLLHRVGKISGIFTGMDPFFPPMIPHYVGFFLGVPAIAPALVLLRTRIADQAFALLLPIYFLHPSHRNMSWPPSPGLAFATLPTLKYFYSELYTSLFGTLEKKWDLAVQRKPRPGETFEQIAAEANGDMDGGDDEDDLVIELDLGWNDVPHLHHENDHAPPANADQNANHLDNVIQEDDNNMPPLIPDPDAPPPLVPGLAQPGNAPQAGAWELRHPISLSTLGSTVMGALFFPAISTLCGNLLLATLPSSLTRQYIIGISDRRLMRSRGLLREQWGRTLVGGAIFVVLKDAVVLYCKWRKARDFGMRRVRDWEGRRSGAAA